MNSIRPLVTISFLAIVGLFLYLKINETAPVIPEDTLGWNLDSALELEIGDAAVDVGPPIASTIAPSTDQVPVFESAPVYEPAPANSGAGPSESPLGNAVSAPLTTSTGTAAAAPAVQEIAPAGPSPQTAAPVETVSAPVEGTANSLQLPPMPALPEIGAVAAAGAAVGSALAGKSAAPAAAAVAPTTPASASMSAAATPFAPATSSSFSEPAGSAPTGNQQATAERYDIQSPVTPSEPFPSATPAASQASLYSTTRLAVQGALDRGELAQALLLLSDWYGDPSLTPDEAVEVQELLNQLAGSVIYSTEHRLEPPYLVKPGERLEDIAGQYNVPTQLLAKINGVADLTQLQPGQQLKVVRGPFSARIDLGRRKLVMMLDRRYAGQFDIDIAPNSTIEEGYWNVNQKLLTPGNVGLAGSTAAAEEPSLLLTSSTPGVNQLTVVRGPSSSPGSSDLAGRVIQLRNTDVEDVYDILSLGSQIIIRR